MSTENPPPIESDSDGSDTEDRANAPDPKPPFQLNLSGDENDLDEEEESDEELEETPPRKKSTRRNSTIPRGRKGGKEGIEQRMRMNKENSRGISAVDSMHRNKQATRESRRQQDRTTMETTNTAASKDTKIREQATEIKKHVQELQEMRKQLKEYDLCFGRKD